MNSRETRLKILYLDDQPDNIIGVEGFLEPYPYEFRSSLTMDEAWRMLSSDPPDILLLDLGLDAEQNISNTMSFLESVREQFHQITVVIYSTIGYLETKNVSVALRLGVSYIIKQSVGSGEELNTILRMAYDGAVIYSEPVVPHLAAALTGRVNSTPLTDRELEIALLVHRGLTNQDIANRTGIRPNTVRDHVSRIMAKLGVQDQGRLGIALWVERHIEPNV